MSPTPTLKRIKLQSVENAVSSLLEALGYDLKDQDMRDTPKRVAKTLYKELSHPDHKELKKLFSTFSHKGECMIVLKEHQTWTRCPHHLERVKLIVSVGYIPKGRYIGVSKLARITDFFSRGLMLQEEIVEMISEGLMKALGPKGVAVVAEGNHLCMQARGVETNASVLTSKMVGVYLEDSHQGIAAREEFFSLIKRR